VSIAPDWRARNLRTMAAAAVALCLATAGQAAAQTGPPVRLGAGEAASDLAQQISNPVANLISVPFQNNFDYGGGSGNALRYTLNVQPVITFSLNEEWNLITRTIVPFSHVERVLPDDRTGIGDVVQSFFLSPAKLTESGITWGVGPVFLYPTATESGLGARQWGAGPTGVLLRQSGGWLYGMLANHLWGLGGEGPTRPQVNATFLQPFITYTFPTQMTLFLNTESTYDWERRQWTVPVIAGVNQLVTIGAQKVQLGAGLRYFAERPEGGPDWGLRFSATLVFPR